MRKLGLVLGGLLLVLAVALGVGIALFDPDAQKPRIVAAVKQATGRDLTINGRIGLAFSLRPTLEIADVALSNPPGFSRPTMASIGKLDLQLALLPLLSRRIEIDRLIVTAIDIRLETDAKGNPNWVFAPPEKPAASAGDAAKDAPSKENGGKAEPMAFVVRTLRLEDSVFSYRNGKTGQTDVVRAKQIETSLAALDAPVHLTAAFELEGTAVALTVDTGPLTRLIQPGTAQPGNGQPTPWPIKVAVAAAGSKIDIDGSIANPLLGTGLNFAIAGEIPDLAALGKRAKLELPELKSLVLHARIADDARGPNHGIGLHGLKLTSSAGDIGGDLAVVFGPPTGLTGALTSEKLDLDALMPPAQPDAAAAAGKAGSGKAGPGKAGPAPAGTKRMIPDTPLPFGQMQLFAADLKLKIGALRFAGSDFKTIDAHIRLQDGVLNLDPASADLPEGHVALTLTADAGKVAPPVHATIRAPGIAIAPLLAALGEPPYASGNLEILADLRGSGESPHAIASSLNGMLGLAIAGGTIDTKRIAGAGARVLEAANPQKAAGSATALRCFALRLDFAKGIGTARALSVASALLNVDGTGTIDLGEETLAMLLKSRATVGNAAVTVPIKVFGPMAAPQTKVDEIGIAQSNAATLGGLFGGNLAAGLGRGDKPAAGDSCPDALALARGQAVAAPPPAAETVPASPAPAAGAQPAKPPNAGQLLKQLFH